MFGTTEEPVRGATQARVSQKTKSREDDGISISLLHACCFALQLYSISHHARPGSGTLQACHGKPCESGASTSSRGKGRQGYGAVGGGRCCTVG